MNSEAKPSIGSPSSRARSALPIAPICSRSASPACLTKAPISWCGPDGGTPAGSMTPTGGPPERLGHRPVPQLGRGVHARPLRDPGGRGLHHRRDQLRHQAPPPVGGEGRPVPRPHRRGRHHGPLAAGRRVAAGVRRPRRAFRSDRYAGWDGPLGTAVLAGAPPWTRCARPSWTRASTRQPRSGRQELLEHVVNRHVERAR